MQKLQTCELGPLSGVRYLVGTLLRSVHLSGLKSHYHSPNLYNKTLQHVIFNFRSNVQLSFEQENF